MLAASWRLKIFHGIQWRSQISKCIWWGWVQTQLDVARNSSRDGLVTFVPSDAQCFCHPLHSQLGISPWKFLVCCSSDLWILQGMIFFAIRIYSCISSHEHPMAVLVQECLTQIKNILVVHEKHDEAGIFHNWPLLVFTVLYVKPDKKISSSRPANVSRFMRLKSQLNRCDV